MIVREIDGRVNEWIALFWLFDSLYLILELYQPPRRTGQHMTKRVHCKWSIDATWLFNTFQVNHSDSPSEIKSNETIFDEAEQGIKTDSLMSIYI